MWVRDRAARHAFALRSAYAPGATRTRARYVRAVALPLAATRNQGPAVPANNDGVSVEYWLTGVCFASSAMLRWVNVEMAPSGTSASICSSASMAPAVPQHSPGETSATTLAFVGRAGCVYLVATERTAERLRDGVACEQQRRSGRCTRPRSSVVRYWIRRGARRQPRSSASQNVSS